MKIDTHNHYIPPAFIEEARRGQATDNVTVEKQGDREWMIHPQGFRYPLVPEFSDLDAKLKNMDSLGIDVSIMTLSPTLLFHWTDVATATDFARWANDDLAKFVAQSDRLYAMAMVPLQDPAAAAAELRRAVTGLDMKGVQIGTTMEDIPLDDERFAPFFSAAEELEVPVVLHPYYVGTKSEFADFYFTNLIGNPLETALAASRLMCSGFFERHPNIIIELVHAGGFMPFQSGRLDHGYRVRAETSAMIDSPPSSYLRRFYFDTITHAPIPLKFLIELVGSDRVVIGTDIAFDMQDLVFTEYLSQIGLDEDSLAAINGGNAARIYHLDV